VMTSHLMRSKMTRTFCRRKPDVERFLTRPAAAPIGQPAASWLDPERER
jgi:hypothetical protein